ncbi:MAG: thioredoxin domain-containing protein [Propionibacteriaceae bacterium]|nr:thioredoxin domain-containing protein [Propionibacteriaceae bacterium]
MSNRSAQSRRAALRAQQELEARRKRTNRILLVAFAVIGAIIVGIVGFVIAQEASKGSKLAGEQITPPNANDAGILVSTTKPKDGVPHVVVWEDFLCGACAHTTRVFGDAMQKLADDGEIKLEYRMLSGLGEASGRAAAAAAAADTVGMFPAYLKAAFTHYQTGYPNNVLRETVPQQIGLTGEKLEAFLRAYDSGAMNQFVQKTQEAAKQANVRYTPYIVVDGKEKPLFIHDPQTKKSNPAAEPTPEAVLAYFKS